MAWSFLGIDAVDEARHIHARPIGVFYGELRRELFAGIVGCDALTLQGKGACSEIENEIALRRHQGAVAGRAVIREYVFHIQSGNSVEHGEPARRRSAIPGNSGDDFVLYDVSGDQRAIGVDKDEQVALCVRAAEPEQARGDAAQVERQLAVEQDVRCAECRAAE